MKPVQLFSDEYLAECRKFTPEQIVNFLEDFRMLQQGSRKSVLISIRVPEPLLNAFKAKAELSGMKYQTKIKELMSRWV